MSWKPMDTAPKDGTVIVLYVNYCSEGLSEKMQGVDAFHAFYNENEGHWDAILEDVAFRTSHIRERTTLLGWIAVPDSSPVAEKKVYRDGELSREPGRLHLH